MDNLEIYNKVREVPDNAKKEIAAGRLKGKTDINPMWRIKALTEQFGVCGIGWKYEIVSQWLEHGGNDEIAAFVNINLYIKDGDKWSDGIPGTGGSSFVTKEKNGLYTSDECFKMALTDAISVSCKALGFGADVYWNADRTKYDRPDANKQDQPKKLSEAQIKRLFAIASMKNYDAATVKKTAHTKYGITELSQLSKQQYEELCTGFENCPAK